MNDEKYDLVFKGQLVKGIDSDNAKRNLAALFKIGIDKAEALFTGKPVILKRNLDADSANKYRVAIKKAGALIDLVRVELPAQKSKPQGKAVFTSRDVAGDEKSAESPSTPSKSERAQPEVESDSPYTLAPAGANLLQPAERQQTVAPEIDVSNITLRPEGGNLLDAGEYVETEAVTVEIEDFDLAPVGADVLTVTERKPQQKREVDTSALTLAAPGVRLTEANPAAAPVIPDTSKITLVDQ